MTTLVSSIIIILSNILVLVIQGHIVTTSTQKLLCKNTLRNLDTCWEKYSTLPICENSRDPLVHCAVTQTLESKKMQCNVETQKSLELYSIIYTKMRDSLCNDQTLYEEFRRKLSCWDIVRHCSGIFAATSELEGLKPEDCKSLYEEMQVCNNRSIVCTNVLRRFRHSMANLSPCAHLLDTANLEVTDNNQTGSVKVPLLSLITALFASMIITNKLFLY